MMQAMEQSPAEPGGHAQLTLITVLLCEPAVLLVVLLKCFLVTINDLAELLHSFCQLLDSSFSFLNRLFNVCLDTAHCLNLQMLHHSVDPTS